MTVPDSFVSAVVLTNLESCFDDVEQPLLLEVAAFVEHQIASLPPQMRLAVTLLQQYLMAATTVAARGPLWRADRRTRQELVGGWQTSRLGPVRQYSRLVRSLVLFCAYESALGDAASAEWTAEQLMRESI